MPTYVSLPNSKRRLLPNSRIAGPVNRSEIDSLTIHVRSKGNFDELESDVNKNSRLPLSKRKYRTRAELRGAFGARDADMNAVETLAQHHNLMVVHRDAAERSIVLKGKLANLLAAFPANVHMYHHARGTYRGRQGEIRIPSQLDKIITGVYGYDTRPKHRSRRALVAGGPGGKKGVAATEFARRYNFPTKYKNKKLDGSGQTIAIIELGGGFRSSDLEIFFKEIKVPLPVVTAVSVDHAGNHPTNSDSDDGEVLLDIEVAGAVAPGATIAVYFARNTDKGFMDAMSAALHDDSRRPSVISISWGGPEDWLSKQSRDACHHLFIQAAALGVTVCAASGDHGVADVEAKDWDKKIHVDHPAADDLVLSCGGTQSKGNGPDVVWNDGTRFDKRVDGGGGWASSGGISEKFDVPAYQPEAKLPVSLTTGKKGRGVPDIAMMADNYFMRVDGAETASGGTSAVAPLMAGLIALLNQAKKKNVGFVNPFLYKNAASCCRDVTKGNNSIQGTVKGYKAGPGWDACTGLGTPDGAAILRKL